MRSARVRSRALWVARGRLVRWTSGDLPVFDDDADTGRVRDALDPDLEVVLGSHLGDEREVLGVEQGPVEDADHAELRVQRHRHREADADLLRRRRLRERHTLVGDAVRVEAEPTRLRRISYAVFCLKKKNKTSSRAHAYHHPARLTAPYCEGA